MPPSEKSPEKSFTEEDPDTRGLKYDTLLDLATSSEISPEDREKAEKSIEFRNKMGITGDDDNEDINTETDLAKHDYLIENGEVCYPSPRARYFRESGMQGPLSREDRETLKEREGREVLMQIVKKLTDQVKYNIELEAAKKKEAEKMEIISATPEEKAEMIMKMSRIDMRSFLGVQGFSEKMVFGCIDYVLTKKSKIIIDDNAEGNEQTIFEKASEPLMVYLLNGYSGYKSHDGHAFQTQETAARWASEYDDIAKSTDIIFSVKDDGKDKLGWINYSIDVTTSVVNDKNNTKGLSKKFKESNKAEQDKHAKWQGQESASWVKPIVFFRKSPEKNAPHFILGLSRDSFSKIANDLIVNSKHIIEGIAQNDDIHFMVASEFYEEVSMQKAGLEDENSLQSKKISVIDRMATERLYDILQVEPGNTEEFREKYEQKVAQMAAIDPVYALAIEYSRKYKDIRAKKEYSKSA